MLPLFSGDIFSAFIASFRDADISFQMRCLSHDASWLIDIATPRWWLAIADIDYAIDAIDDT